MTSASFTKLATVTGATKRPAMASGKQGTPVTLLSGLSCTPLDPVDPDLQERLNIRTVYELKQTSFYAASGQDIREGDLFVVGSTEYWIRSVAEWPAEDETNTHYHLVIEEDR